MQNKIWKELSSIALLSLLPAAAVTLYLNEFWIENIISLFFIFTLNYTLIFLYHTNFRIKFLIITFKCLESIFSLLVCKTQGSFSFSYVFENHHAIKDIILSHPTSEIIFSLGLLLFLTLVYVTALNQAKRPSGKVAFLAFIFSFLLLQLTSAQYVFFSDLFSFRPGSGNLSHLGSHPLPKSKNIKFNREENIILLTLESMNSKAINGNVVIEGQHYTKPMAPRFLNYAKRGIYFPEFYSNGMLTVRADESLFCGKADNLGMALSMRKGPFDFKCLPEFFNENGFSTYFFKSDELYLQNGGAFMKKIGFQSIHNEDIMKPGGLRTRWGYIDDTFYTRVFDYLKKQPPGKKFIHIAVSGANHYPFEMYSHLKHLKVFEHPKNFYEKYANCLQQQDFMLQTFFQFYDKNWAHNTHLIVSGDQSYPVGINGTNWTHRSVYDDTFLTSMFYLPPKDTGIQPRVVPTRYDYVSLFHTILELFSGEYRSPRSIPEMTPNAVNREQPLIRLNQPSSGKIIAFIRYPIKWVYSLSSKLMSEFNLEQDPFEQHPRPNTDPLELDDFFAFIYSGHLVNRNSASKKNPDFPVHIGDDYIKKETWNSLIIDKAIPQAPYADVFNYYFSLKEIPKALLIKLRIGGVEFHHRIFINGVDIGEVLPAEGQMVIDYTIPVEGKFLKKGENNLLILNDTEIFNARLRTADDYVVYDVKIQETKRLQKPRINIIF